MLVPADLRMRVQMPPYANELIAAAVDGGIECGWPVLLHGGSAAFLWT